MTIFYVILPALALAAIAVAADEASDAAWQQWKAQYGRSYDHSRSVSANNASSETPGGGDESRRRAIWQSHFDQIEAHNSKSKRKYTMKLHAFADLTEDEFRKSYLGAKIPTDVKAAARLANRQLVGARGKKTTTRRSFTTKTTPRPATTRIATTTRATTTIRTTTRTTAKLTTTTRRPTTTTTLKTTTTTPKLSPFSEILLDWRKVAGALPPVKNQGGCGSCWSFAAIGALESRYAIKYNRSAVTTLSEQELVDCSSNYGNGGCSGGWPDSGLQYVGDMRGVASSSAYGYTGLDETCKTVANRLAPVVQSKPTTVLSAAYTATDEAVMEALKTGPLIAAVKAFGNFQNYGSGVFTDPNCVSSPYDVDHAIIIVGYGEDRLLGKYWVIRNSWGSGWGEGGYMRMARGSDINTCNLLTWVSYPNVI